jgi:hypothetical protein
MVEVPFSYDVAYVDIHEQDIIKKYLCRNNLNIFLEEINFLYKYIAFSIAKLPILLLTRDLSFPFFG